MIVVDTNVISEPLKAQSSQAVVAWLERQYAPDLYLAAMSLAELLIGIGKLPEGRRKRMLDSSLQPLLTRWFGPRILPFDQESAGVYAKLMNSARAAGQSISFADGQIAAIAKQHGFAVATRDRRPFEAAGLDVIDPWKN